MNRKTPFSAGGVPSGEGKGTLLIHSLDPLLSFFIDSCFWRFAPRCPGPSRARNGKGLKAQDVSEKMIVIIKKKDRTIFVQAKWAMVKDNKLYVHDSFNPNDLNEVKSAYILADNGKPLFSVDNSEFDDKELYENPKK